MNIKGIYYGFGMTNVDRETGIRYGVIPITALSEWTWDLFECVYEDSICSDCEDGCYEEPLGYILDDGEYIAEVDFQNDVFILKSPYYTYAQFCSPCAPGACYLLNPVEPDGVHPKVYCFGPDWFEKNNAPYPIYSVETGELITEEGES